MAESCASCGLQPAYPNTEKSQRIHTLWSRGESNPLIHALSSDETTITVEEPQDQSAEVRGPECLPSENPPPQKHERTWTTRSWCWPAAGTKWPVRWQERADLGCRRSIPFGFPARMGLSAWLFESSTTPIALNTTVPNACHGLGSKPQHRAPSGWQRCRSTPEALPPKVSLPNVPATSLPPMRCLEWNGFGARGS